MPVTVDRLQGRHYRLTLTTGTGDISISLWDDITVSQKPELKDKPSGQATQKERVFDLNDAEVNCKGFLGVNNAYGNLPDAMQRIVGIEVETVGDDGVVIADADNAPNLVYDADDNATGLKNWAVTEKEMNVKQDESKWSLKLQPGVFNAKA